MAEISTISTDELLKMRQQQPFDPEGTGFDLETFKKSGGVPDETGHMGSLDPRTGMLLKGINHPTINLTLAEEKRRGNKIVKRGDRFFSVPASQPSIQSIPTQELLGMQSQQPDTTALVSQLRGRLPAPSQFIPNLATMGETARQEAIQRQSAFEQLERQGGTREQIQLALDAERRLKSIEGLRIGKTIGGTAAGLLAGQLIPGPADEAFLLRTAISALGAGGGGAAGEAIQVGLEEKRLIGKREALNAFASEAAFEAGGRVGFKGLTAIASPFIKRTVPEAASLVDDFAKVGGSFSPTELDDRFTLRVSEAFARGSFGAEKIFQEFEEKQGKAVVSFAQNIVDSIGEGVARQTPEEIGEVFAQGITRPGGRIFNIFDELIDPLYKQVDELAKVGKVAPKVSTNSLKSFATKQLATDKRLNGQFLSPIGRNKLQKIIGMGDDLSFSDMRTLRSSFLRDARKLARDVDQSQSIIKQLAGITDKAIFDPAASKGLNPEALRLLRNTNALYRSGQEGIKTTFSETLAKRLLRNPSNVVKEAFPNNNPKAIRLLRKSLTEPIGGIKSPEGSALWNQLRQTWLADAVEQATKEGVAKPKVFDNILRKLGPKAFAEMFPEKQIAGNVRKIQSLFSIAGKAPPRGVSLFSRGAQLGGLALMYDSGKEGDAIGFTAGATLAIGPMAFARLATTPGGVKFLTSGFRLKPGAEALGSFAARATKRLVDLDKKNDKQRLKGLRLQEARSRQAAQERTRFKTFVEDVRTRRFGVTGRPLERQL